MLIIDHAPYITMRGDLLLFLLTKHRGIGMEMRFHGGGPTAEIGMKERRLIEEGTRLLSLHLDRFKP